MLLIQEKNWRSLAHQAEPTLQHPHREWDVGYGHTPHPKTLSKKVKCMTGGALKRREGKIVTKICLKTAK